MARGRTAEAGEVLATFLGDPGAAEATLREIRRHMDEAAGLHVARGTGGKGSGGGGGGGDLEGARAKTKALTKARDRRERALREHQRGLSDLGGAPVGQQTGAADPSGGGGGQGVAKQNPLSWGEVLGFRPLPEKDAYLPGRLEKGPAWAHSACCTING